MSLFFSLHEGAESTKFRIIGMVCYVGRHYLSFYWSHEFQCWLVFNDAKVKQVSAHLIERQEVLVTTFLLANYCGYRLKQRFNYCQLVFNLSTLKYFIVQVIRIFHIINVRCVIQGPCQCITSRCLKFKTRIIAWVVETSPTEIHALSKLVDSCGTS